ncbi:MAG: histidine kinase [Bacteroidales bacterium]|nr:histidine kinase [Bacteroidales bacterium]
MFHPIVSRRTRFFVYLLIWLVIGLAQSLLILFSTGINTGASFTDGMVSAVIFALIAIALWFPVNQLTAGKSNILMGVLNHLGMAIISLTIWIFATRFIVLSVLQDEKPYMLFWEQSIYYRIGAGAFMYAVITLTYYLIILIENISRKNMKEAKLENMLKETELMMLRSQINPHFLFNSLNSISSLTISDATKAREMVIKLSEFMRYALSKKEDRTVTLETELKNLRLYLEIEKVRFGERLVLEEKYDKESLAVRIPNMILQPLYENAIKHGVYESTEAVSIKLEAKRVNGAIEISIVNDFDPDSIPAGGTGTGLNNVRRRLELYYGHRASLQTHKGNNIFTAKLHIPEQADVKK